MYLQHSTARSQWKLNEVFSLLKKLKAELSVVTDQEDMSSMLYLDA